MKKPRVASPGGLPPPGVLDLWGGGQLLAFSGVDGPTPYRDSLVCRTSFAGTGLLVKIPGEAELHFGDGAPRQVFLSGDAFDLHHAGGRTRGAFLDACHLLIEGPCQVRACDASLSLAARGPLTLVAAAARCKPELLAADLDAAFRERLRWILALPKPPALEGLARKTFWKCLSVIKTCLYSPEGRLRHFYATPDRWPHRGLWLWDSAFTAIGLRHLDARLAREAISAVLDVQHPDGQVQISYFHRPERIEYTQPPTLALAAQLVYRSEPRKKWLAELFPRLAAYLEWDLKHRDVDGDGLLEWKIEPNAACRCGESGWDNSPRFDAAKPLNATDFNAFLARECEALADFARVLGKPREERKWSAHCRRLRRLMNRKLWSERLGLYVDAPAGSGEPQPWLTAAGFLPLLCKAPSKKQAQRLARHLHDPDTFATALPVATMSPAHREHYSKDMWRGPVWVNVNWCIIRGFERYGMREEADRLRRLTLAAIEKYYARYGVIFEFFDDADRVPPPELLRKRRNDPRQWIHQVIHDYTWTATLYLDLLADVP